MRTIPVQALSQEAFSKYGVFHDTLHPTGSYFGDSVSQFYRDLVTAPFSGSNMLAVSPLHIIKRPYVVDTTEIHSHTAECLVPMDADIIIHVGEAMPTGKIPIKKMEAFFVPKGMAVTLLPGVFHYCPYVCSADEVTVLILLPQRTYANDCTVYQLSEDQQILIDYKG